MDDQTKAITEEETQAILWAIHRINHEFDPKNNTVMVELARIAIRKLAVRLDV